MKLRALLKRSIFVIISSLIVTACSQGTDCSVRKIKFDQDWKFHLGQMEDATKESYDDSEWRVLNLPHDWSVEPLPGSDGLSVGPFSKESAGGFATGQTVGGEGWYRKSFTIDRKDAHKLHSLYFEGVYAQSEVWVNGQKVNFNAYGYSSFKCDITSYCHPAGEVNTIAVKVTNEGKNSRWYAGSGIYRHVWFIKTDSVHLDEWAVAVRTAKMAGDEATLAIEADVLNEKTEKAGVNMMVTIISPDGEEVGMKEQTVSVDAAGKQTVAFSLPVKQAKLWSVDTPHLYEAKILIRSGHEVLDQISVPFGIRTISFSAKEGFKLNNLPLKLKGGCVHHDNGLLGAASLDRAEARKIELLKANGYNAVRCAHNPPAEAFLRACDEQGMLVIDEAFDMWRKKKTAHDYARYFNEWHERDLNDFILRDRNHPSVFMWSIGNEVLEQWSDAKADTLSLEEANLILNFGHSSEMLAKEGEESVNSLLTKKLVSFVKGLDPTRPVTAGCNEPNSGNHLFRSGVLDVIGYNYHNKDIPNVPANFPDKPFIITESNSALMTRGYYRMPSDRMFIWPKRWDKSFADSTFACSSYENCHVPWGNTHEESLKLVRDNDFISGQYVWTGFDYIGEPTPYGWPARSSYFGIVDLAGFPKDVYYLYQSEWTDKQVLHLFPHWNWTPGQEIDMWCYYNQADEVELFVNGKSQGVKRKDLDNLHVAWRVKFEPGTVKVIARESGKVVAEKEICTAGKPAEIRLTPDRSILTADGKDLCFVTVEVLDEKGNLCPDADNLVNFTVQGNGFIAGVDLSLIHI